MKRRKMQRSLRIPEASVESKGAESEEDTKRGERSWSLSLFWIQNKLKLVPIPKKAGQVVFVEKQVHQVVKEIGPGLEKRSRREGRWKNCERCQLAPVRLSVSRYLCVRRTCVCGAVPVWRW
jgi:hypothetical protein